MAEVSFNEVINFSRASTATYWGPSGTLLEAAVDEARIQHDPETGKPLGLLIEEQRTNLLLWSEDFTSPGWSKGSNVSLSTQSVSKFGNVVEVTVSDSANQNWISQSGGIFESGDNAQVRYAILQAGTCSRVFVGARASIQSGGVSTEFDISLGQVVANGFGVVNSGVEPLGGGWFLCWMLYDDSLVSSIHRNFTINASEPGTFLMAHTQAEKGASPTSYIPTTDSPVTRAADEVSIDLSDVFNPDEGTLIIAAQVPEGGVVASLGDIQIVSDSDEKKSYRMTYSDYTGVPTVTLGNGIHSKLEYLPEAQS